jgi:hypothetical protein
MTVGAGVLALAAAVCAVAGPPASTNPPSTVEVPEEQPA